MYYVARLHYYLRAGSIGPRAEGIAVSRRYLNLHGHPIASVTAGSLVAVQLSVHADHWLEYLDLEDPLPAGFEPVDQSLNTSQQATLPPRPADPSTWLDLSGYLDHADLRDDRVSLYTEYLPAGDYTYTYLAQATDPGTYEIAPTHARETFFPEVFGHGAGQTFTVR
jgi:uncharacterized protein YfaS (alpha-2-macroglobulin family)